MARKGEGREPDAPPVARQLESALIGMLAAHGFDPKCRACAFAERALKAIGVDWRAEAKQLRKFPTLRKAFAQQPAHYDDPPIGPTEGMRADARAAVAARLAQPEKPKRRKR